jgi:formylglycine-generating enzyme required for sulfatase activity
MAIDQIEAWEIMSTPARLTWEKDGKHMVLVPGGRFSMGCDEGSAKHQPEHSVHVEAFYIDRFPVTNHEFKCFADATGHPLPHYEVSWCDTQDYNWDPKTRTFPEGKADHPVVLVTWQDALAYAQWADKRLPSEAEWELAARGLDGRIWPWGNQPTSGRSNTLEAGIGATTPVGQFTPQGDSQEGVADMIGNVWEWTSSLFRPYPYDASDGRETLEANGWRVLRGGSWVNDLSVARTYTRLDGDFLFFNNVGFRCAASIPEPSDSEAAREA